MIKLILKIVASVLLIGYLVGAGMMYHAGAEPMRYREVSIHICDTAESALSASVGYTADDVAGRHLGGGQERQGV